MIENTISINDNEVLETAVEEAEETELQKNEDMFSEKENVSENEEATPEENTIDEGEELLTLTVYGETVTVPRSEAVSAAQKGMAFESMKQKLAAAKGDARLRALDGLAQISGKSVSQLLSDMTSQSLTQQLCDKYGELEAVPFEELEKAMKQVYETRNSIEKDAGQWQMAEKRSQLEEFLQYNPGCRDIPEQVIEQARKGENLTLAYSRYQTQQLAQQLEQAQKELEVLKSAGRAKEKSMPSARSTAADSSTKSIYGMMRSLW